MNYKKLMISIDVEKELNKRGLSGKISGENIMMCCLFHEENNPSFGISLKEENKGIYNCRACGESGNFIELLSYIDRRDYNEVKRDFENKNIRISDPLSLKKKLVEKINTKEIHNSKKVKYLKKDILKQFKFPYGKYLRYLVKERKLTLDTIRKYGILCCDNKDLIWYGYIGIPIWNEKNKLMGITFRYAGNIDKKFKVRKITGSDVSKVLYGLKWIESKEILFGVEGELDTLYLQQKGVPAVQVSKNPSKEMLRQLIKLNLKAFYYLPDGDVPWTNKEHPKDCVKFQLDRLRKYLNCYVGYFQLPEEMDPNTIDVENLKKIKSFMK